MIFTAVLPSTLAELHIGLLQAVITFGVCVLCAALYYRYRKRYFFWWAVAWALFVLRIGAIGTFLTTRTPDWLYLHQVLTGWTALALLWAAIIFSQQARWRWWYAFIAALPLVWSYVAIYMLRSFLLAAGFAVVFLSFATLWTARVFFVHWRRTASRGAAFLAVVLFVWGLHHLDYPLLRERGLWNPWGYYLDILLVLATGAGILLLVLEDVHRGLSTLLVLSGDLQPRRRGGDVIDALLARPLSLPGVHGSALFVSSPEGGRFVSGLGVCAGWTSTRPVGWMRDSLARALREGKPEVLNRGATDTGADAASDGAHPYTANLPIFRGEDPVGALVIVGTERDPFTALGDEFLLGLGRQVGAALENADLWRRLEARSRELARLSSGAVHQHEEERRRISLALHDETAQVFSVVKMQLGLLRESVAPDLSSRIDRVLSLVDEGIGSIRNVTSDLRPPLLDDLGLIPALRALVTTFGEQTGLRTSFDAPGAITPLSTDAELALFRALQEALSNVARHSEGAGARVTLREEAGQDIVLEVRDDGRGFPSLDVERLSEEGHMGIAGMRERVTGLGGGVELRNAPDGGAVVTVTLPISTRADTIHAVHDNDHSHDPGQ